MIYTGASYEKIKFILVFFVSIIFPFLYFWTISFSMKKFILAFCFVSTLLCQFAFEGTNARFSNDLEMLANYMYGTLSSSAQAKADTNFMDICLHMTRIWDHRTDGIWMYVEQAAAEKPGEPYRQRIYRLSEEIPGIFESRVFEMPDPVKFVGAWKSTDQLNGVHPGLLTERTGCSIFLVKNPDNSFSGSTRGKECLSSHRGADYAVSIVFINRDGMVTWERGFNNDGNQVWGSENGGYIFKKIF